MSAPSPAGGHRLDAFRSPRPLVGLRPAVAPVVRLAPLPPVAFNAAEPPRTESLPVIEHPDASTVPPPVRGAVAEAEIETRPAPLRRQGEDGWILRLPDGSTHRLVESTVLGRYPVRDDGVRRILIADCELGVSRAHARIRVLGDLLTVEDLGSTNGTYLVDEDGRETRLPSGEPLAMPLGWSLDLANVRLELWAPSR